MKAMKTREVATATVAMKVMNAKEVGHESQEDCSRTGREGNENQEGCSGTCNHECHESQRRLDRHRQPMISKLTSARRLSSSGYSSGLKGLQE
jgi:hypothetical protein